MVVAKFRSLAACRNKSLFISQKRQVMAV